MTAHRAPAPPDAPADALARVPLFAALDPARLRRLAGRSAVRDVAAGTVVARYGQPATHLVVVEAGSLTGTVTTADGRVLRVGDHAAPCAIDKVALLDGSGHTATWTAATRARLRTVPAAEVLGLVDDVPAVRRHVLRHLARQVREQQAGVVLASFADTTTRTAAWLVRAMAGAGTRVLLPGAQQGLAETIGATRVSVNRALRSLATAGLIRTEPGAVVILAPELLARRAGADAPT